MYGIADLDEIPGVFIPLKYNIDNISPKPRLGQHQIYQIGPTWKMAQYTEPREINKQIPVQ